MSFAVIVFIWVLAMIVFWTPVLIVKMSIDYRTRRHTASNDHLDRVHEEIAQLRADMDGRFADLTLMLDEAVRPSLPADEPENEKPV